MSDPDRGPDGKKDLIVEEVITGIASEYTIRWLVSCKHFAHSGSAVKDTDEINIKERLSQHRCDGVMGVYSTLPAVSLSGILSGIDNSVVYDHEKIESLLLRDSGGQRIASRYFPKSYSSFIIENPVPADLFSDAVSINCEVCGADLLSGEKQGIYVSFSHSPELDEQGNVSFHDNQIQEIHFACKGECDTKLCNHYRETYDSNLWEDVDDLKHPTLWIKHLMAFINYTYEHNGLSEKAFNTMKQMFIRSYPYVARNMTTKEKEKVKQLLRFGLFD